MRSQHAVHYNAVTNITTGIVATVLQWLGDRKIISATHQKHEEANAIIYQRKCLLCIATRLYTSSYRKLQ